MNIDNIDLPIADLCRKLRAGSLSSAALIAEAEARYAASEGALNAYKNWTPEIVRAMARAADALFAAQIDLGPLQGLPISVKDNYGVAGMPIFAGCRRALGREWEAEGGVVAAIRRQAGVLTGKTHTVELAFSGLGINAHWGTPRNPWDAASHRLPGGSSSGAGVSLCQGSAVLALGTDTAGSVRIPASWTGTAGLKTSTGRWPTGGIVPLSRLFDTAGILARSAADLVLAVTAIERLLPAPPADAAAPIEAAPLAGLRLGLPESFLWQDCASGVAEVAKRAVDELARAGARIVPVTLPELAEAYRVFLAGTTTAAELSLFLHEALPDRLDELDPFVAGRVDTARDLSAVEFLSRRAHLARMAAAAATRFTGIDALLGPTVAISPPLLEEMGETERYRQANLAALRNTSVVNLLDLCAVTLPVGLDAIGMPVGLQFIAAHGRDRPLLAIALAAEGVLGDARRRLGRVPA